MNLYTDLLNRRIPQAVGFYVTGAWFGIEVTSAVFEAFEFPQAASRLVILLALAGFPLAMFVGWRYNLTARGIERTPEKAGWFARFFVGVVVITIVAASIMVQRGALSASADGAPGVAVLAMRDGAAPAVGGALGRALGDEILLELSALPGLRVAASTTSYALSEAAEDVRWLADEMGVQYVIEGSLQQSSAGLRAIVSVVDAQTGYRVWTGAFVRGAGDAPALAKDVATGVARQLADVAGLPAPDDELVARSATRAAAREEG